MCLVLGRPGTIDWRHGSPALPADVCVADTARTLAPSSPKSRQRPPYASDSLPVAVRANLHLARHQGPGARGDVAGRRRLRRQAPRKIGAPVSVDASDVQDAESRYEMG